MEWTTEDPGNTIGFYWCLVKNQNSGCVHLMICSIHNGYTMTGFERNFVYAGGLIIPLHQNPDDIHPTHWCRMPDAPSAPEE